MRALGAINGSAYFAKRREVCISDRNKEALKNGIPYPKGVCVCGGGAALVLSFPFAFLTLTRWTLIAWLNYTARPLDDSAMPGLHLAVDSRSQSI